MKKLKFISRTETGYVVKPYKRGKKIKSKFFGFKMHGGITVAKKSAILHRDLVCLKHDISTGRRAYWGKGYHYAASTQSWYASWGPKNDRKQKAFSVKSFGKRLAKKMAIEKAKEMRS